MLRLLRLISWPQLRASWGRTLLVVAGIATGVALISAIDIVNTGVVANFRKTIDLMAGPAALEVTLGVGEVRFDESIVRVVRADPDVVAAVPLVRGTVALADDPAEALQLVGADLTAEADLERYRIRAVADRRELLRLMDDPRSVLLTTAVATRYGLEVGKPVSLATPRGIEVFTVRGLLETEGLAALLEGRLVLMDLPAAQLALGREGRIDQIDVVLGDGAEVSTVQERLARALPPWLRVSPPAQRGADYGRLLKSVQDMIAGLSSLCLIAGIYIVYNATSTGAVYRASVLAGLRLLGAEARHILRLLLLESLLLGAVGGLVGVALGIALATVLAGRLGDLMDIVFQLRFPLGRLSVDATRQLAIAALGPVAALAASWFAARRASRLEPIAVLRGELPPPGGLLRPRRLVTIWALTVGLSVAALLAELRFKSPIWGNVSSNLWNASVLIVAIPLVGSLRGTLDRVLGGLFGPAGRFAAASLFRAVVRSGVTVAAVGLVVGVGIALSTMALSFRESLNRYTHQLLAGDLVVSAVTIEGGWLETPLPEALGPELSRVAGVRRVETMRILPGLTYRGQRIGLLGMSDGLLVDPRFDRSWYREGDPRAAAAAVASGTAVNVSFTLSDRFALHAGDTVALDTPTGPLTLPIVGVVPDYSSSGGAVILSRRLLAERWREPTVNRFIVDVTSGSAIETVRASIKEALGTRFRLTIASHAEVARYHSDMVRRAFAYTDAIQLLVIIMTVAGILDLLLASIAERRREIALWRVIGADATDLRRAILLESGTLGVIGAILGTALGLVTAWMWVVINYRYFVGYHLDFYISMVSVAGFSLLILAMTTVTGTLAAWAALRQSPLTGIRAE